MLSASKGVGSRLSHITKGVDFRIDSRANFYELEGNFVRVAHIDKKMPKLRMSAQAPTVSSSCHAKRTTSHIIACATAPIPGAPPPPRSGARAGGTVVVAPDPGPSLPVATMGGGRGRAKSRERCLRAAGGNIDRASPPAAVAWGRRPPRRSPEGPFAPTSGIFEARGGRRRRCRMPVGLRGEGRDRMPPAPTTRDGCDQIRMDSGDGEDFAFASDPASFDPGAGARYRPVRSPALHCGRLAESG